MSVFAFKTPALLLGCAFGLAACTYPGSYYGSGYGDGYGEYDYPDECYDKDGYLYEDCKNAGYVAQQGYGYYDDGYNNGYGSNGWYNGYYYPGYSVYIYDRQGHRHDWDDNHRRHWEGRRGQRRAHRRDSYRDGYRDGNTNYRDGNANYRDQRRSGHNDRDWRGNAPGSPSAADDGRRGRQGAGRTDSRPIVTPVPANPGRRDGRRSNAAPVNTPLPARPRLQGNGRGNAAPVNTPLPAAAGRRPNAAPTQRPQPDPVAAPETPEAAPPARPARNRSEGPRRQPD